ncbi:leucine-rich repeat domain-containing protein [uncultured Flavobacterium sp.]|jgi:hypothetical protein|uniref:leucine-rich repeat domain-containing protein n=1 Tax=uncultured Flavobacterium sp. TaxID=165435 RepID=UPI002599A608|nr:leucine-rich repeat domain-containing protein [uncultured Flavobacterium sp.]
MELSESTRHLLAQHLHWGKIGYDPIKLNEVVTIINKENLLSATRLHQIERKIGSANNIDFKIDELEKLTYLYPCLIKLDGNLNFLKYCINIEEIDLACLDLKDIGDLVYLKKLINLNLCSNDIDSIDALANLKNLEKIDLTYCKPLSLKPLLNHNKIKNIRLEEIENEADLLEIISNQEECSAEYIIKNSTELYGLTFPKYWVFIKLKKETLSISMTSLMTDKWSKFCEIAPELINDKSFYDVYIKFLNIELDKRVTAILKSNFEVLEEIKYLTEEEIEFQVKMKIKKH